MGMRKSLSLKLLAGIAAISCVGALYGGNGLPTLRKASFTEQDLEKGTLSITRKDVDISLSGRVRQDWIGYDKIYTLQPSNDDQLSGFRSKSCIDFAATYGNKTYGRSAADAFLRLTNYGYWYYESYYTPFNGSSRTAYTAGDVRPLNMLTYMEEMWINMHLGTFFDAYDNWFSYKNHPVSIKMGYFPYQLGRGIAFGDAAMHIPYLGWDSYQYDDARFNHPGILLHGYVNKNISYDLYYTKQSENSLLTAMTWETINENRTDGRRKWRGISKGRDLWAAKMDLNHSKKWGDLHAQPYVMYVDAPELKIEVDGDSAARLGTTGMMLEFKRGRFSINAEVAGQFGHQNVHAIDRNKQEVVTDVDTGIQINAHSHVFVTSNIGEAKTYVNGTCTAANVNITQNRGGTDSTTNQWIPAVTKNGDQLYASNGTTALYSYDFAPESSTDEFELKSSNYNSNVTGNKRFRDGYRVDYRGYMAVCDMKYEFEDVPVSIALAGAYISGDRYPYNTERDKRYRGFLTYGDYNYVGKYVYSQVVLEARKLPRPVDISYHHQYAFNNVQDMGNLAYIGTGATWRPFKDKNKLMLRSNILWFWETVSLKRWNVKEPLPTREGTTDLLFQGNESWPTDSQDGEYVWVSSSDEGLEVGTERFYKGWMKNKHNDASRRLGTELNFEMQYRPVVNCILLAQLGCFIPGQLYKDLKGQPNVNTINGPLAYRGVYGLGDDPVWRLTFSLDYRF
jgi:hypothetical protein